MSPSPLGPRSVLHRVGSKLLWPFALTLAYAYTAAAQTTYVPTVPDNMLTPADPIGIPPHASSAGTNESVNLSSGGLSLFIPVLSLPQRGGWTLDLGYVHNSMTYAPQQNVTVSAITRNTLYVPNLDGSDASIT